MSGFVDAGALGWGEGGEGGKWWEGGEDGDGEGKGKERLGMEGGRGEKEGGMRKGFGSGMEATECIGCEGIRAKSRPQKETGMWKLRRETVLIESSRACCGLGRTQPDGFPDAHVCLPVLYPSALT